MPLVIPPLLIGLGLFVSAIYLYGLTHSSSETTLPTLHATMPRKKRFLRALLFGASGGLSEVILRSHRYIRSVVAHWAWRKTKALAAWFGGLTALAIGVAHEIEELGLGIEHGLGRLTHVWIPRYVHRLLSPIDRLAHNAYRLGLHTRARVEADARRFARGIDRLNHRLEHVVMRRIRGIEHGIASRVMPRIRGLEGRLGRVISRDLPALRRRERALERALEHPSRAWLKRIGAALWATSLLGLMVRYLVRRFPWLYCRNVNRLARTVCGLPTNTIDGLVAALVGAIAVSDLRTIVRFAQEAEEEAVEELRRLLNAL